MSDYPRDLVNKDGKVQEFKRIEDVPPGWFVRDTGEEVNPAPAPVVEAVPVDPPADLVEPPKPKKGKIKVTGPSQGAPIDPPNQEIKTEVSE